MGWKRFITAVLHLLFYTAQSKAGQGCHHKQDGFAGTIFSNNYPQNYNNSLKCEWFISSRPSTKIQLRMLDFQLEKNPSCKYDFLEVYDGKSKQGRKIGRYCGTAYPDWITSSSNSLYLYLETDRTDSYRGFEATWFAVSHYSVDEGLFRSRRRLSRRDKLAGRLKDTDKCGSKILTESRGVLTSPNYPKQYPSDSTCYWTIESETLNDLEFTFQDFEMEQHNDCRYDYVLIKDGIGQNAKLVGKYCGNKLPKVIRRKTKALRVELISDSTTQRKGFKAKWKWALQQKTTEGVKTGDCGGKLNSESGMVQSPGYPNSGDRPNICIWYITVPTGGRVKFEFTDVKIVARRGCRKGYVQINDGRTRKEPNLGVFCGTGVPKPVIASTNTIRIGFFSDGSGTNKGFRGKWMTVYGDSVTPKPKIKDTQCGKVFYDQTGVITRTQAQNNCSWTIKVPSKKAIILSVGNLDMKEDDDCRREEVTVTNSIDDGGYLLLRMCGVLKPKPIRSTSNEIIIHHTVTKPLQGTRISLFWKTVEERTPYDTLDEVTCGLPNFSDTVDSSEKGAFPWTVGIMGLFNRAHCGGAIISAEWVMTSAHCFDRLPWTMLWSVRAGEFDLVKREGSEQNRNIRQIIIHPEYNRFTYDNDIALLRLDRPLTLTRRVRTVCLPPIHMPVPTGKICSIAGWGLNRYMSQSPTGPLEHILPAIVPKDQCNEAYNGKITNNMICAGDNGLDSCQGDGGSPLSCVDDGGKYHVLGLSSWGNGCALPGKYGVYTDVRTKVQWVKKTVSGREEMKK